MGLPDKLAVWQAVRGVMVRSLETMVASARDAAAGATHEENRSEGDKDMRATEQSYVARGQAMRAEGLAEELARFDAIKPVPLKPGSAVAAGALVQVELDDEERVLFIAAQGGGTTVEVDGTSITVVTPSSPMGQVLLGKHEGDELELVVRGKRREGVVLQVL